MLLSRVFYRVVEEVCLHTPPAARGERGARAGGAPPARGAGPHGAGRRAPRPRGRGRQRAAFRSFYVDLEVFTGFLGSS